MKSVFWFALIAGLWLVAAPICMAKTPKRQSETSAKSASLVLPELINSERQFWEAWKNGKPGVFEQNMSDDAVFFGQYGVASKSDIVQEQRDSAYSCKVQSYALTAARAIPIDNHAYILLYEAEQRATCGGNPVAPFMHGSSIYVRRAGKWVNVFRSEVPRAK